MNNTNLKSRIAAGLFLALILYITPAWAAANPVPEPPKISYQIPTDGPLPKTWRVTLAIVDSKNPDWIISQFARGVVRTVTPENQGRFSETWDGLDDNFMPVPPRRYAVKGIYMPADKWLVDNDFHSITPRFVTGAAAWLPTPEQWNKPEPFGGDPVGQSLGAVTVAPSGLAVFYYVYLENGLNCPVLDLNKIIDYQQFIRAYHSGGAAGGDAVAFDGQSIWAFSTDGGPKFVYRADQKPFGNDVGANRNHVYRPDGWVTAMTCWRDVKAGRSFVYIAQRGKFRELRKREFTEDNMQFANKVTVHEGESGKVLAEIPLMQPRGLAMHDNTLYALHENGATYAVSYVPLDGGLPRGGWKQLFALPHEVLPFDLAIDSHGRFYLSEPRANKVYQMDRTGKVLLTYGRLDEQKPQTYDPLTLMSPGKLAVWTDQEGNDRLIIVEQAGPNRAAEWSADGKLLREFLSLQTKANDGYAIDPQDPSHVYIAGHQGWLTRFKVDREKRTWTVDAVWPDVGTDPVAPGFDHPQFIRVNGREYLACARSNNIYRHEGDRWVLSAAIIRERNGNKWDAFAWHDKNGTGRVRQSEDAKRPLSLPGNVLRYHGNQWLDDLSLVAINQGGRDVWRLAPEGFDAHGNPIFMTWQRLLTDPVLEARAQTKDAGVDLHRGDPAHINWPKLLSGDGTDEHPLDAIHGGNELSDRFSSDWAMADGSMTEGFYVVARGGPNFSANEGSQTKISRHIPDGAGGYKLKWHTGREAMQRLAEPGEIYGAIHLHKPINGLLSIVDQSRCGILLYTDDGLYVDTIFPDGRRFSPAVAGVYPQPGEFFAGAIHSDPQTGKIYFAMGKYTPMLFEAQGWSLKLNPVRVLEKVQKTVEIDAAQIASPPEIALSVRGGAGAAHVARFAPALGGVTLDGSMAGWESCEPVAFSADKEQTVEVRCLYDPDHLYLRWHARLGAKFEPKALQPADRIFTHDRLADTLSFYFQGDPTAKPGPADGRPADVRLVFGLFNDNGKTVPIALGMFPQYLGSGKPSPLTYATPVGKASFEHVGVMSEIDLGSKIDEDGKGFVLCAAIPRTAVTRLPSFTGDLRTMANFSATFAGHNKFWWANRDGSASRETYDEPTEARLYPNSWAPAQFQGLGNGVVIRNWLICGPFGGPGAEKFQPDPRDKTKDAVRAFCESAHYPPDDGKVDLAAVYKGEQLQGYWPPHHEIRWKPATIADLDTRIILGPSGQTWYGATWIYAPAETELEFQFQYHPQTFLRFFVDGKLVQSGEVRATKDDKVPVAVKKVVLRKGWSQLMFRGYCIGYPPFRAGVVLSGTPEKLWKLKVSAQTPP